MRISRFCLSKICNNYTSDQTAHNLSREASPCLQRFHFSWKYFNLNWDWGKIGPDDIIWCGVWNPIKRLNLVFTVTPPQTGQLYHQTPRLQNRPRETSPFRCVSSNLKKNFLSCYTNTSKLLHNLIIILTARELARSVWTTTHRLMSLSVIYAGHYYKTWECPSLGQKSSLQQSKCEEAHLMAYERASCDCLLHLLLSCIELFTSLWRPWPGVGGVETQTGLRPVDQQKVVGGMSGSPPHSEMAGIIFRSTTRLSLIIWEDYFKWRSGQHLRGKYCGLCLVDREWWYSLS